MTDEPDKELDEILLPIMRGRRNTPENLVRYEICKQAIQRYALKARIEELEWSLGGAKEGDAGADWINRRIAELKKELKDV